MTDEPLYELRKDVSMPGAYWRAGTRNTEKEWRRLLKIEYSYPFQWAKERFIDLRPEEEQPADLIYQLVSEIFTKHNLHSITYKEAACECVREGLVRFKQSL